MSLDSMLQGLETQFAQEAQLLELAKAWIEKTDGIVAEGMQWDAEKYITELQRIPLWERVKESLPEYTATIRSNFRLNDDRFGKEARLLVFFPQLIQTLEGFLDNPIYSEGKPRHQLGSPLTLSSVVSNYDLSERKLKPTKGTCQRSYSALKNSHITEEFILESIGMRNRWASYQSTKKLPEKTQFLIRRTLEKFLEDPLYSEGSGNSPLASPLSLGSVLNSYVASEKTLKHSRGDCRAVYVALRKGYFTEEFILTSTGLRERWEEYLETKKIPESTITDVRNTLCNFLLNPLYSSGNPSHASLGLPLTLHSVLRSYVASEKKLIPPKGDCHKVYQHLLRSNITEDFLLQSVGLQSEWADYQQSTATNPYQRPS